MWLALLTGILKDLIGLGHRIAKRGKYLVAAKPPLVSHADTSAECRNRTSVHRPGAVWVCLAQIFVEST